MTVAVAPSGRAAATKHPLRYLPDRRPMVSDVSMAPCYFCAETVTDQHNRVEPGAEQMIVGDEDRWPLANIQYLSASVVVCP